MSTATASNPESDSQKPRCRRLLLIALSLLLGSQLVACGGSTQQEEAVKTGLHVQNAYMKRPVPGRAMTAAYATLINYTQDTLCFVGFETDVANAVELHVTEPVGGPNSQRVAMRRIREQCIAPDARLTLKPGGMHLMIMGLIDQDLPESVTLRLGTSSGRLFATEFATVPFNYSPENL